jgi:hypothetical protein
MAREIIVLAVPLILIVACGQSDKGGERMETRHNYSLCPKADDSRERFYEQVKNFAGQQEARFIDRSAEAQRELSSMRSNVLDKTGGSPILLTVEKSDEFRISVTNLGLRNKIALTIRSWGASAEVGSVVGFMDDLGRLWTIQRVEGGVTDDPPC